MNLGLVMMEEEKWFFVVQRLIMIISRGKLWTYALTTVDKMMQQMRIKSRISEAAMDPGILVGSGSGVIDSLGPDPVLWTAWIWILSKHLDPKTICGTKIKTITYFSQFSKTIFLDNFNHQILKKRENEFFFTFFF